VQIVSVASIFYLGMTKKSLKGSLLLDGGKLHGSFFHQSVVLICKHDDEGAFGLILNRITESKVSDVVVADLPGFVKKQPIFIGGPVQPNALSYIHSDTFLPEANVMANLNLGHSLDELLELGESGSKTQKIKLFAGYSGWEPGQLEKEMARNDWLVHPATLDLIFTIRPEQLWKTILHQKGGDFRLLSQMPRDLSLN
jgi:putative transcriptional regulator